ncbi:MAG: type II toxin-antitoxin system RatA family toxin [Candidatus Pacebacteria bacterium]|nr:type II toxin-antitoxin system RatA family toxin [Candidatus Paceibacterota bacterium]
MLRHHEKRHLNFTPEQIFDLVADVKSYPEFLPWCLAARIHSQNSEQIHADLVVGSGFIRETFTSRVALNRPTQITVHYDKGPLAKMHNAWHFSRADDGGCIVEFTVEFEFKNRMFHIFVDRIFDEVVRRMVNGFEQRAKAIYPPNRPTKIQD